ncbi:rRNA-processing protein UTP23 homolog [Microcaecilia unicolor]|uniref:rRNA-processing protein UTP23 homolog n=1 Tax=Microcaecilia unicolor TaxID=1415580 RepID=A0A6P7WY32_9AMPH|nr:rRNA-processing protein UTP23 homolog [Microcaecilia unicolor]
MKIRRQKQAKKTLSFYKYNFGFRPPLQVMLDGTFCQAALTNKIQIKEQLPKYLMGDVQLCTTSCVLKELESLGKELYGAKLIAQRFQVRNCSHLKNPVGGSVCLLSMLGESNPHHYFIATQDQALAGKVKKKAGVPLLFIIQNTMVLDKPSPKSVAFAQTAQEGQLMPVHHRTSVEHLKEEQGMTKYERRGKKRKQPSGPNPLSCLKKKKKQEAPQPSAAEKKRKRNRKRRSGNTGATILQLEKKSMNMS